MQENNKYIEEEEEIDLRELFRTIWDRKMFIIGFTLIVTILAGIYAYSKTPIYEAKALIEIGEYKTAQNTKVILDDASSLRKNSILFLLIC